MVKLERENIHGRQGRIEFWLSFRAGRRCVLIHGHVDQMKRAYTVLVERECDLLAVVTQIPVVDVKLRIRNQVTVFAAREIYVGQSLEFRFAICRDENPFPVLGK